MVNSAERRIGLVSFPAFFRGLGYGGWANSAEVASLKAAMLLYDRLLVAAPKSQVMYACEHFANEYKIPLDIVSEVWGSIDEVSEGILYSDEFLERCKSTIGLVFPTELERVHKQYGQYWYNGELHLGRFHMLSLVALPLWSVVKESFPYVAMIETSDLPALGRTAQFQNAIEPRKSANIWDELAGLGIPDPGGLNWQAIFNLFKSEQKKAFQDKVLEIASGKLGTEVANSLWDVFRETKKDIKPIIIKSVISEIPLPLPINPLSILFSIQDIIEVHRQNQTGKWLSFLVQVRSYRDNPIDLAPSTEAFGWAGPLSPNFSPPDLPGIPREAPK